MKAMNITDARKLNATQLRATVAGCPLRFLSVIIPAETDGKFYVTTLGFAAANGFEPVK